VLSTARSPCSKYNSLTLLAPSNFSVISVMVQVLLVPKCKNISQTCLRSFVPWVREKLGGGGVRVDALPALPVLLLAARAARALTCLNM